MRRIVRRGITEASPDSAHAVHVDVGGLRPDRPYWYQFDAGGAATVVGRTRTLPLASAVLVVIVMPATFEEIAFRGFMMNRLAQVATKNDAPILQAVLFAVAHLLPFAFISHFALGLALGWIRRQTNSLYPCIAAHALWNTSYSLDALSALAGF